MLREMHFEGSSHYSAKAGLFVKKDFMKSRYRANLQALILEHYTHLL